ncbi:carbohydrate ABC transporter permease [Ruania alba]|uniref:Raffinose/stachyose/melibiose transport system permease protein n=1 Tax=Ruania alba TaxID=648782 RepID=A0A1H5GXX4_9MICO|nr:sugar ABC transporter permease [Ruania alba]SEE20485.1 raffinose/stachyose/melibiose transport system permease protein [Ruania alba]
MTLTAKLPSTVGRSATRSRRTRLAGYLYVLPALLFIVGIVYFGAFYNAWISTLDWNGIDPDPEPVGAGNYADIAADPTFWTALSNVVIFGVVTILVQMGVGLLLALVLSGPVVGRGIYRAIVFIPVVLAPAAVSTAFRQFYHPDGKVNELLGIVGLDALQRAWIADPDVALFALTAVNIFAWTGFSFLLYQAGLSQIDTSHLEAAQLDGAGTVRTVWSVVVPQLRMTHVTLALTGVIGSLKMFDFVFLITGGGPGRSTEFLTTYIYKEAIVQFNVGYGAALSMVVLVIALLLTVIQMRIYRLDREG